MPPSDQDAIAAELISDRRWTSSIARSSVIARVVDEEAPQRRFAWSLTGAV